MAASMAAAIVSQKVRKTALGFDFGRSSSWRAMHAFSLSHGTLTPSWFGLEPGRKLDPSPRLAFGIPCIHGQVNYGYPKKGTRPPVNRRPTRRRHGAP